MSTIIITVRQKAVRVEGIENEIAKLVKKKYSKAEIDIDVSKKEQATSRAERFGEAMSALEDAKSIAEELRDELQEWRDGLPENLQNGSKADELDEAIGELEEFISNVENCEGNEPSFPGMY